MPLMLHTHLKHTIQLGCFLETNSTVQLKSNKNYYTMLKETATNAAFKKTDIHIWAPSALTII
jgi:hypothetical protein